MKRFLPLAALVLLTLGLTACPAIESSNTVTYQLAERDVEGISGSITFTELDDGSTEAVIELTGTPADGEHPAHIHANSAAEGGPIVISFTPVDGNTGTSTTMITETDAGAAITYEEILDFDGYVNVHLSAEELGTIVAQGDIGANALTGESITYTLEERAVPGISGTVTFEERNNGFTKATIELANTPADGEHPAHIHANSAAEGGPIVISFTPVDGDTGSSVTTIRETDAGAAITYEEILDFDGYVNVHLSAEELGTIVAQGDIGVNALTGESTTYTLEERAVAGISGTVTFEERISGFTKATIELEGTPADGEHPAHIHANSAAEGGPIVVSFTPVDGDTGTSVTTIRETDAGATITYEEILDFDGYVNVHLSAEELGTIVAQGDIGANALTGESITYTLEERAVAGISGTITFEERNNGFTKATIELEGTPAGGEHPAHIHANSAAQTGPIVVSFTPVDGDTGTSVTTIRETDAGAAITYEEILDFDGYVNVHLSMEEITTIVAQGDIGSNATP